MLGVAFAFLWIDFTAARDAGADHWWLNPFTANRRRRLTAPIAGLFGLSFLLLGLCAYGAQPAYHDGGLPKFWDVAYLALSRSAWCIGLLLCCFLCFQGYGGAVRALLENRVTAVLSRLTFAAYLVHPALIFLVFQDQQLPIHYSTIWCVGLCCGWWMRGYSKRQSQSHTVTRPRHSSALTTRHKPTTQTNTKTGSPSPSWGCSPRSSPSRRSASC